MLRHEHQELGTGKARQAKNIDLYTAKDATYK